MKRYLIAFVAAAAMLFSSCEKEDYYYLETGMWEMTNAPSTYVPTTLSFSGKQVSIMNANSYVSPFEDGVWNYYIVEDSDELNIYRDVLNEHGERKTERYSFDLSMSEDGRYLKLVYDHWYAPTRIYEFRRV